MAAEIVYQVLTAGKKLIDMVKNAKECEEEANDIAARMEATLLTVDKVAHTLNDSNEAVCHSLRELKKLIVTIEDLVEKSLRSESSSAVKRNAKNMKRAFFSGSRLKEVENAVDKLGKIKADMTFYMVANQQPSKDVLLALEISQTVGPDRALKLVKRRLEGKVIFDELEEEDDVLGAGSFGVVKAGKYYGKPVAIKKALSNQYGREDRAMFGEEANTHFLLQHDRVVKVFAFSVGEGSRPPCLIMERMDGTLHDSLERGSVPLETRLEYIIDICEGLNFLSQHRVVHRDIKSQNILLYEGQAKVSDFGLAQICSTIGTKTGNTAFINEKAGTQFWMAPEVFNNERGRFDSDIFSLHVVMWEIIENTKGGKKGGLAVGFQLLTNELAKLPLTECDDPCEARLHKLVRDCGLKERKARPKIDKVLAEAKSIYDSVVRGSAGGTDNSTTRIDTTSSSPSGRGSSPPPSESRRRDQEQNTSEDQRVPQSWKHDGRSLVAAGGDNQGGRLARAKEAMEGVSSSLQGVALRAGNMHLACKGDRDRSTAITIYNATGSPMRFRLRHDIHGGPDGSFPTTIDNGKWEVVLHVRTPYALYGSEGYVVYTAQNGDGQACDVLLCFMTSYQRIRSVYVEAKEEGHWDNNQHRAVVTTKINENRNKSYSLSDHGLSVNGVIAHDSPRPCQFIVGIEGSEMPAPWA